MSVVINAYFDNPDTADFALANLKRNGTSIEAYKINPLFDYEQTKINEVFATFFAKSTVYSGEMTDIKTEKRPYPFKEDVIMSITVSNSSAYDVESMLINSNGRQIKQLH